MASEIYTIHIVDDEKPNRSAGHKGCNYHYVEDVTELIRS